MGKSIEIRDPIHGFIVLNEWERDIINHPVFQRLRRIRQLGLTDMVYPGAMHTRFEHSLGVMHVATCMFDEIVDRHRDILMSEMQFSEAGFERDKAIIRISSLLHDVGHPPFSHAAEELMPNIPGSNKKYKHDHYSAAVVLFLMKDIIENHKDNDNLKIKVRDIADFISGDSGLGRSLFWKSVLSGNLDADRADYLLRDSYHIGVAYGKYDLPRLLKTLTIAFDQEIHSYRLAIDESGIHTAEAIILARYMMFTQVYFHHTRRAYDFHLAESIKSILLETDTESGGIFPPPKDEEHLRRYLEWTDWRIMGMIQNGGGGEHGRIIRERKHYRRIWETPEVPGITDLKKFERKLALLNKDEYYFDSAEKSWYKFEDGDISILKNQNKAKQKLVSILRCSNVVKCLKAVGLKRIYVPFDKKEEMEKKLKLSMRNRR
jgi:uncharacterized protein